MADWDCEAIIGLMSKIFSLLLCMFTLTLSSCGSWFYCNVSSYGTTPNDKSFYLIPTDSCQFIGEIFDDDNMDEVTNLPTHVYLGNNWDTGVNDEVYCCLDSR